MAGEESALADSPVNVPEMVPEEDDSEEDDSEEDDSEEDDSD